MKLKGFVQLRKGLVLVRGPRFPLLLISSPYRPSASLRGLFLIIELSIAVAGFNYMGLPMCLLKFRREVKG